MNLETMTPAEIDALLVKTSDEIRFAKRGEHVALRIQDRERLDAIEAKVAPLAAVLRAIDVEFNRRGRWTRFQVVAGCHVHAGFTACSTFKRTTRSSPLPELSGSSIAELVTKYGTQLCSVCFPKVGELPEFKAAAAAEKARREEREKTLCPGSRTYITRDYLLRYAPCPECKALVSVRNCKARAHDAPEPAKAGS